LGAASVAVITVVVSGFRGTDREVEERSERVGVGVETWWLPSDTTCGIDHRNKPVAALATHEQHSRVLVVLQRQIVVLFHLEPVAPAPRDAYTSIWRNVVSPKQT
jgi:hypothetical protein